MAKQEGAGYEFLHSVDPSLHTKDAIQHEQDRRRAAGEEVSQRPADEISAWLKIVERTHTGHRDDPGVLERIKRTYHDKYVIKPDDLPKSFFDTQRRLAREQGHGDVEIPDAVKRHLALTVINDQKASLDSWVDYLSSPDSAAFPMWAKYWCFRGMLKLSAYNIETKAFGKRDSSTTAPFADLNTEALAYVFDSLKKIVGREDLGDDPVLQRLSGGTSFGKLYALAIEKSIRDKQGELQVTDGIWVKYPKGSDCAPLVTSLQGYGTGWCTAGEETAKVQLSNGDFYVYYSIDSHGKSTIPRVAIRMEGGSIAEVRGVAYKQNLDPYIGSVVDAKLVEFPDGKAYQKKSEDMKLLTMINAKMNKGESLTMEELRFLYELDSKIQGFGYHKDPRVFELRAMRNQKEDLAKALGCREGEIAVGVEELQDGTVNLVSADGGSIIFSFHLNIPGSLRHIYGDLGFEYLNDFIDLRNVDLHGKILGLSLPDAVLVVGSEKFAQPDVATYRGMFDSHFFGWVPGLSFDPSRALEAKSLLLRLTDRIRGNLAFFTAMFGGDVQKSLENIEEELYYLDHPEIRQAEEEAQMAALEKHITTLRNPRRKLPDLYDDFE